MLGLDLARFEEYLAKRRYPGLVAEIVPEIWVLGRYVSRLSGPTRMRTRGMAP